MLNAIPLLVLLAPFGGPDQNLGRFNVVSYSRKETFAGSRGSRVEETLVLERSGDRYTLSFPRWHTVASRYSETYCVGEPVTVAGSIRGARIVAKRSEVRNVLPKHRHDPRDGSRVPVPSPETKP